MPRWTLKADGFTDLRISIFSGANSLPKLGFRGVMFGDELEASRREPKGVKLPDWCRIEQPDEYIEDKPSELGDWLLSVGAAARADGLRSGPCSRLSLPTPNNCSSIAPCQRCGTTAGTWRA